VSASGGSATLATKLAPGDSFHDYPAFLPDQQRFVVFVNGQRPGLYLGSLGSLDLTWLTEADSGAAFMPPGWLLFVRDSALVARRFDIANQVVTGDAVPVAEPLNVTRVPVINLPFSVSATGMLAYRSRGSTRRQLVWVDRTGKRLSDATGAIEENLTNPEISPDGRRIVAELSRDNNQDVWVIDWPRRVRISTDPARDAFPIWSHDGSRILFGSQRTGQLTIFERPSDGSGAETRLQGSPDGAVPMHVSRDGRFLTYLGTNRKTREDVGVLPLVGERNPRPFTEAVSTELWARFSPNGKWITYQSNETGIVEVYLRPFPGPGGQWPISTAGGIHPRWSADGKEVYYISPDGKMMAVSVAINGSTPVLGTPVALFDAGLINGGASILGLRQQYDVSKDGRFLLNVLAEGGSMPPITVLLNWAPPRGQ
jgi:Tol biopolymer transport system component